MTDALTETVWLKVLQRIVTTTDDDTKRTLAQMLYEIILGEDVDRVLDVFGSRLLERQ